MSQTPIPQGPFGHWHEIYAEPQEMPWLRPSKPEGIIQRLNDIDEILSSYPCSRTDTSDSPPNSSSALDNGGSVLGTEDPKKDPWLYHEWPKYPTEPTGDLNVPFYPGPENAKILAQIRKAQYLCDQAVQDFTQAWEASHPWPIRNHIEVRLLQEDFRRYIHPFVEIMAEYVNLLSPSYLRSRADTPGNPPAK